MDNKITKQRVNTHLEYDWFKYILILAACIGVWIFVFGRINALKSYEKINFFIVAYDYKNDETQNKILKQLSDNGDTVIQQVGIVQELTRADMATLYQLLATTGLISSDILILPYDMAITNEYVNAGAVLDDYKDRIAIGRELEFFNNSNGQAIAIIIDLNWRYIENYLMFEKPPSENSNTAIADDLHNEYYMILNPESSNAGQASSHKTNHTQSIDCIKYFVDLYF